MTKTPFVPLLLKRGNTFSDTLTVTDRAGAPLPLTDATLIFYLRERDASTNTLVQAFAITGTQAGEAMLTLSATQTAALVAGVRYAYEVELVQGTLVGTVVEGSVAVLEQRR